MDEKELIEFLKENLKISIKTEIYEYGSKEIEVKLTIKDQLISSDYFHIN